MLKPIDKFLNGITMYRLLIYGLGIISAISVAFGFTGIIAYDGLHLLLSLAAILATCYVGNFVFSKIFRAATNIESSLITGFILFFLFFPATTVTDFGMIALGSLVAMASKYLIAPNKRHIFNPAAFGAFILGFAGYASIWWVGSTPLFPFVLVFGLLVVRKIRREQMFVASVLASTSFMLLFAVLNHVDVLDALTKHFLSWPIIFFASVMITEPFTTPPTKNLQLVYGVLVGALSSLPFHFGPLYSTPEFALVIGNVFSYAVSLKRRLYLRFQDKKEVATDTFEFSFAVQPTLHFYPGQYLEWTLPHAKADMRGDRRYFTIASSPTEDSVKLGVKFAQPSSSFKQKLLSLGTNDVILAGQLGGDFVLPQNKKQKLVFVAGGIGITPFRSMIKYLVDSNERRDIVIFYCNRTTKDIAYWELFNEAEKKLGLS